MAKGPGHLVSYVPEGRTIGTQGLGLDPAGEKGLVGRAFLHCSLTSLGDGGQAGVCGTWGCSKEPTLHLQSPVSASTIFKAPSLNKEA